MTMIVLVTLSGEDAKFFHFLNPFLVFHTRRSVLVLSQCGCSVSADCSVSAHCALKLVRMLNADCH